MILRKITKGKGRNGAWIALLILAGYLAAGVGIAWATYGGARFTLDPELWSACFLMGLAGAAAWVLATEILLPGFWAVAKAFGKILPVLGIILVAWVAATLLLTFVLGIVLAPSDASFGERIVFTLEEFLALATLPAIFSFFWAISRNWSG